MCLGDESQCRRIESVAAAQEDDEIGVERQLFAARALGNVEHFHRRVLGADRPLSQGNELRFLPLPTLDDDGEARACLRCRFTNGGTLALQKCVVRN